MQPVTSNVRSAPARWGLFLCALCVSAVGVLCLQAQDPGSMASKVTRPSPCADGQVLKYNATSGLFECQDDLGGGSGGDNISVNGAAAADADFDNATPAAPANAVNVRWQKDALTPNNLSAHLLFSDLATATFGSGSGFTWAFNASAGTDPVLAFGNGVFNLSTGTLQQAGTPVVLNSRQILSGNGLSGGGDLSADRTLALALLAVQDGVGAAASNSGLEFAGASSDTLALLQGCANGQLLKWTAAGGTWGCANDNDSGAGTAAWEALVNSADTATSYTSNNTAETVTFSFESAFGASQQFLIRQQTGNPTAGTLLDVRAADAQVTVFRAGDGTNGIAVSQAGALTAEGTGSITATAGDSATSFFSTGNLELARLPFGTANQVLGTNAGGTAQEHKTLSTGTAGTDFAIAHAANSITFNLPDAGAAARGAITTGTQTIAGAKTLSSVLTVTGGKVVIDGTDQSVTAGENAIAENGGTTSVSSRGGITLMLDNDNNNTGQLFSVCRNGSCASPLLQINEDGTAVFTTTVDAATGYQITGNSTAGRFLRHNGTRYVQSSGAASGTGSCTDQVVTSLSDDAAPTCSNVSSAMISNGVVSSADLAAANKTLQITYSFFDPAADLPNTLDVPSVFPNRSRAITLTEVYCEINAGSASINLQRDDGSPANILSSDLACSTAGATSTAFVAGENALAVGHNLDHITVSVGAGLRRLNLAIKYTVD